MSQIDVGARLRVARKAAGYGSSKEFIQKLDIPRSTYSQHESGKRVIDASTLKKYCEALNINEEWLLTGSGPVFKNIFDPCENIPAQELSYIQEMNKLAAPYLYKPFDIDLLSEILAELFKIRLNLKDKSSFKSIVNDAFSIYFDITKNSQDKLTNAALLKTALHVYDLLSKQPTN